MGPNIKFIPYHASIGIRHVNKFPLCPIEFDELERIALKSLKITEPIVINDSLPFGSDNMDTLNMPEADLQSMADRFNAEIHEEPNMESGSTDVTLMFQLLSIVFVL